MPAATDRRRWTVAGCAGAALLALAGAAGAAGDSRVLGPPRAIVTSHGVSLSAARGAFCWPQASGEEACVAGTGLPRTRRAVPVHRRGVLRVDTRVPAERIVVRRVGSDVAYARARKRSSGPARRWRVRLPRRVARRVNLLLDVTYSEGQALFGVALKRHRHR